MSMENTSQIGSSINKPVSPLLKFNTFYMENEGISDEMLTAINSLLIQHNTWNVKIEFKFNKLEEMK